MASPRLLFVCTGNATRSVIAAGLVRRDRPDWVVDSAGTWAIPGLPSSRRTLAALEEVGVSAPGHRSTTLTRSHLDDVDLVIGFEADHVTHIRRLAPGVADITATLPRLLGDEWVRADANDRWLLPPTLAAESVADWPEVDDPAGQEVDAFIACARAIADDIARLLPRLDSWDPLPR